MYNASVVGKNLVTKLGKLFTRKENLVKNRCEICHVPVMLQEVLDIMKPKENQVFLDMTFGGGGHTRRLLESNTNVKVFCLDRDPNAYKNACEMAPQFQNRLVPMVGKFTDLPGLLEEKGIKECFFDGVLFDFGCSSMQFDNDYRGFALSSNGPLDMRMDGDRIPNQPTAADVVRTLDEDDLYKIIKIYGEEKRARVIARAIIEARFTAKFQLTTTKQMADLIQSVLEGDHRVDKLQRSAHPATKTFQALRIFVNNELNEINIGLELVHRYLKIGAPLVALSFHSLEDRIVKRHIMQIDFNEPISTTLSQKYKNCQKWHSNSEMDSILTEKRWNPIHRGVVYPSEEEIMANPRSRSAKLRAATKHVIEEFRIVLAASNWNSCYQKDNMATTFIRPHNAVFVSETLG